MTRWGRIRVAHSIDKSAKVREVGGEVRVFSSLHVSGEQLEQLSGLCAILRFPMAELEDTDSDSDVE